MTPDPPTDGDNNNGNDSGSNGGFIVRSEPLTAEEIMQGKINQGELPDSTT